MLFVESLESLKRPDVFWCFKFANHNQSEALRSIENSLHERYALTLLNHSLVTLVKRYYNYATVSTFLVSKTLFSSKTRA